MEGPYVQRTGPPREDVHDRMPIAFLDRDGVINKGKPGYVNGPEEVRLLDGAAKVIGDLNRAGYLVCVVTNQSPISRGLWGPDTLQSIHEAVQALLYQEDPMARVDLFLTCPHRFEDRCPCRKPSPGMLSLGHRLLREVPDVEMDWRPALHPIEHPAVDWWGASPEAPHPLDLMVGDRRSDMGAGWAFGARIFRVHAAVGLQAVGQRLADENDPGDGFQP